jgi:hypothetical protein
MGFNSEFKGLSPSIHAVDKNFTDNRHTYERKKWHWMSEND